MRLILSDRVLHFNKVLIEPSHEKMNDLEFRTNPTQIDVCINKSRLDA